MRKIALLMILASALLAQNLQLHYELADERKYFVSTLEMFKPDQYGSTFWFVDMEYNSAMNHGISLAYWEFARAFTLPVKNLAATLQYNDGVANFGSLGQVWLLGVNYTFDLGFMVLPLDILYRAAEGADSPDFQLTTTWFVPLLDGNIEFSGFMDLWSQDKPGGEGKQLVLLSEPQVWYNANDKFSIGSEVEVSQNFVFGDDKFKVLPTLGLRWKF